MSLKHVLVLFILCALVQGVWGQESENISAVDSPHPSLWENNIPQINSEDILKEGQVDIDRCIAILNIVATSMGVLVGLLTLIFILLIAGGAFEYSRWRSLRKRFAEKVDGFEDELEFVNLRISEVDTKANQIEKDAKVIGDLKLDLEEDVKRLREEKKNRPTKPMKEKSGKDFERIITELIDKIEMLEKLGVSLDPDDYVDRGDALYNKEDYSSAILAYRKAIELDDNSEDAWDSLGNAYTRLKRYKEGLEAHKKALKIDPDNDRFWFNLACNYSLLGNKKKALDNLSKAIDIDSLWKEEAKEDEDFKSLREDEEFLKLVED